MHRWVNESVRKISADFQRSADTHLIQLELPAFPGIDIYLKDESTHPTGSLKHRLARSLFLYNLCNGNIKENTTVVESSSGSTAVSEAYFARMIGVPFLAVMPRCTARSKIQQIEFYGGQCHYVDGASDMCSQSLRVAESVNGYFMDQFTYAERATDWRGNNNIADSIFRQMQEERYPIPKYIVMSAGTGGTSATLGRYIRYKGYDTDLVVVDPENSVFYDSFTQGDNSLTASFSSRIEGIGRPQVEPSFLPNVIDQMVKVPDAASIAAIQWLESLTGKKAGGSTGTNLWGVLQLVSAMADSGQTGSVVTLMCDGGERYLDTYYNARWVDQHIGDIRPFFNQLDELF